MKVIISTKIEIFLHIYIVFKKVLDLYKYDIKKKKAVKKRGKKSIQEKIKNFLKATETFKKKQKKILKLKKNVKQMEEK